MTPCLAAGLFKYTCAILFEWLLPRSIPPTWQDYAFPGKRAGDLKTDQDLMVAVILYCLLELPPRGLFFETGIVVFYFVYLNVS